MQLTIDKYTQMVAPIDVRDLDLANAFHAQRLDADSLRCLAGLGLVRTARASATGELGNDRRERFDVVGADDHVADPPTFAAD